MSKDLIYDYVSKRLTQKIDGKYYAKPDISTRQCENKLGQIEDLMERFDLDTVEELENALKQWNYWN